MVYGYCRISTKKQSINRQISNIKYKYPEAVIITETYTGTKFDGRIEFNKLLKKLEPNDIIVFDSVSRFSRDADEGFSLYKSLLEKGITLEFIKEPYINTNTYTSQISINNNIKVADNDLDSTLLEGIRKYLLILIEKQIKIAFQQSEKEVKDLRERTIEGLREVKASGKKLGRASGTTITTKKSIEAKKQIKQLSKEFNGNLKDKDVLKYIKISRKTYYKYKKELLEELNS